MNRRGMMGVLLAGGGVTVASALWLRKPGDQGASILHPVAEAEPSVMLQPLDNIVATLPPRPVPALAYQDEAGAPHGLTELRGKIVVLNVWATWCQPCIAELPALARLAREGAADGIAVVALSVDRGGAGAVRRFLTARQVDLPIRVDPQGVAGETLGLRGLPTTLLIDRQGLERARLEGATDWASGPARAAILKATG